MKPNFLYKKNRDKNKQKIYFEKCIKFYELELNKKDIKDYINYYYLYYKCFDK